VEKEGNPYHGLARGFTKGKKTGGVLQERGTGGRVRPIFIWDEPWDVGGSNGTGNEKSGTGILGGEGPNGPKGGKKENRAGEGLERKTSRKVVDHQTPQEGARAKEKS